MDRALLDVRTKLLLLLFSSVAVFLFYSFWLETLLIALLTVIQFLQRRRISDLRLPGIYIVFVLLQKFLLPVLPDTLMMMLAFFVVSFRRLFPCMMSGLLLITTTTVAELMSGLERLRMPRQIIIPLAVTLRYLPAVKEELGHIRDAMKMRETIGRQGNIFSRTIKHLEEYYVPLLVSAAQISEELSAAAITRGIENPVKRTVLGRSRFRKWDVAVLLILAVILAVAVVEKRLLGGVVG